MSEIHFYYSSMNAGKSTRLLQCAFNYEERGMGVICLLPEVILKFTQSDLITSRLGVSRNAIICYNDTHLPSLVSKAQHQQKPSCVFVDEAQFLSKEQVSQLCQIVDQMNIPVMAYGLRTDFQGNLFVGSQWLLTWADHVEEIPTVCFCGKKAIMTARVDATSGEVTHQGPQILCGGNDIYLSFCRKHYQEKMKSCENTLQDACAGN